MRSDLSSIKHCQMSEDCCNHALGQFILLAPSGRLLTVVASDGHGWEHVSVSVVDRCPTWEEMQFIKTAFWDDEEVVIQFHPRQSQYVNAHPYVLHLWKPDGTQVPEPPRWMVGPYPGFEQEVPAHQCTGRDD